MEEINMPRETAAQKRSRISALLADYDNRSRELRKLDKIVEGLKEQVREIEPGKYGEWERADGTPREIVDNAAIKARFAKLGEAIPMRMSAPPMVVRPVVK